ncbi:hypothetical protein P7H50_06390 [Enterococcus durans]|uniref:hypothetical protein n=1 Tax=Enterococcus TaxID=1350 RepID=UPI00288E0EEB|nr:hypothetical protein [Enterococcus durans]MDT2836514.1 hypothetical protein [Enterococcus durans]
MFQIKIDKNALGIFSEDKQSFYQKKIFNKVEDNLDHQFYRIKPIRNAKRLPVYELKITLEKTSYRLAFTIEKSEVWIYYISKTIQKQLFDKEALKWLSKRST